jgi:3-isopropylmalate/(R)-2-methylmalate dehydratase small subunit
MQAFKTLTGIAIPFGGRNIDTDVIIPADYLKAVTRTGMGKGAFKTLRRNPDGTPKDNIFDTPRNTGAPILIAGDNFGCGSSREHAAWALGDMGVRAVIAPSYSDIFAGNAFKNGIVTVVLPQEQIDRLLEIAPEADVTVDLENQVVTTSFQDRFPFAFDAFKKHCLMGGLDEIGITLQSDADIASYEARQKTQTPWLNGKAGVSAASRV